MDAKTKNSGLARWLCAALFASSGVFALSHTIYTERAIPLVIALFVGAVFILICILHSYGKMMVAIQQQKAAVVSAALLAICFSWGSYSLAGESMSLGSFVYGTKVCYLAGFPATWLAFFFLIDCVKRAVLDIKLRLELMDIKICVAAFFLLSALMVLCVSLNSQWYMQLDSVCSMDSGFVVTNILPNIAYFDIRHPVLSLLAFPVWSTYLGLAKLMAPVNLMTSFCVIGVQLLNIAMIVACGAMLKVLTKSRTFLVLFLAAYPTLISSVAIEKYIVSMFFVVLTIYSLVYHKAYAPVGYALAVGIMPTNAFALCFEFVNKDSIKDKLKRVGSAMLVGVLIVVCSGHCDLFDPSVAISQIQSTHQTFGSENVSILGRLYACLNLFQGSFIPLTLQVTYISSEPMYWWPDLVTKIRIPSLIIVALMVVGFIRNHNLFATRAAGVWIVFAFVLFVGFNWAPTTSALFTPIFYWAVILLFAQGLAFVLEKVCVGKTVPIVIAIATVFVLLGIMQLIDINGFMEAYL